MSAESEEFTRLGNKLGYKFKKPELLKHALTHSSLKAGRQDRIDNERLEFLGDRVLALTIAELLWAQYPGANEGDLARMFNRLVRLEACAQVARSVDLGENLLLSDSEQKSGGRRKNTILGNACEAILGAVFLDGGFDAARRVIRKLWAPLLQQVDGNILPDAKSALQEWVQQKGTALPRYVELERTGPDHALQFTIEVRVKGYDPVSSRGPSKRFAEQEAALAFLVREGIWDRSEDG